MEKPSINYKWYQFQKNITIEIYEKGIDKSEVNCNLIKDDLLEVSIKDQKYMFDLDGTVSEPQITSNKYKIEVNLTSTSVPIQIVYLLKIERPSEDSKQKKYTELDKLGKEDEIKDPMDSMRDIYKSIDEKGRHAMMKSFYESGGTVLSSNYDEVFSGKVLGYHQQKEKEEKEKELK